MRFITTINAVIVCATLLSLVISTLTRRRRLTCAMREASISCKTATIPGLKSALPGFEKELARARRGGRPLAAVVLTVDDQELIENIGILVNRSTDTSLAAYRQAMTTVRIVFLHVGSILRESMRESDMIAYDTDHDDYVIVMPDSTKAEADSAIRRLTQILRERTMVNCKAGFAEFPANALTMDELLRAARAAGVPASVAGEVQLEAAA